MQVQPPKKRGNVTHSYGFSTFPTSEMTRESFEITRESFAKLYNSARQLPHPEMIQTTIPQTFFDDILSFNSLRGFESLYECSGTSYINSEPLSSEELAHFTNEFSDYCKK
jgi:hypothetical protein